MFTRQIIVGDLEDSILMLTHIHSFYKVRAAATLEATDDADTAATLEHSIYLLEQVLDTVVGPGDTTCTK